MAVFPFILPINVESAHLLLLFELREQLNWEIHLGKSLRKAFFTPAHRARLSKI